MNEIYNEYNNRTVLVTGGAGSIGGNLSRRLIELGAKKIIILDDLSSAYQWNVPLAKNVIFIHGSILDDEILRRAFKEKPNIIFHLAAHFANQNSVDNPEKDLIINGMGILKVLEHAQMVNVDRFVYSSSGCGVYGLESKIPFEEHDVSIHLHTPYQITKLLGELYTNYFHSMYDVPIVNARFFNVFGPGEVPGKYRNVIPNFMYWSMKGLPLPITGNGSETRDWTYVGDIIDGLLTMGIKKEAIGEAFNLGSGKEHTVLEMATLINKLTGNSKGIKFTERRDWDVKTRLCSSIGKAQKALGYQPRMDFEVGLKNVHQWFMDNWKDIEKSAEF